MAASEFLSAGKNLGMYIESVVLSARAFVVINPKGSLSSDQCWLSLDYRVKVPTGHSALNRGEAGQHTNK
jgi:hypothetical protein